MGIERGSGMKVGVEQSRNWKSVSNLSMQGAEGPVKNSEEWSKYDPPEVTESWR